MGRGVCVHMSCVRFFFFNTIFFNYYICVLTIYCVCARILLYVFAGRLRPHVLRSFPHPPLFVCCASLCMAKQILFPPRIPPPPTSPARFHGVRDETLKKKEKEKSGDKNLETLGTKRSSFHILHMCPKTIKQKNFTFVFAYFSHSDSLTYVFLFLFFFSQRTGGTLRARRLEGSLCTTTCYICVLILHICVRILLHVSAYY